MSHPQTDAPLLQALHSLSLTDTSPEEASTLRLSVPKPPGPYVQFVLVPASCLPTMTQPVTPEIPIRQLVLCCLAPIKWFRYLAWCVLNLEGSIWISQGPSISDRT